MSIGGYLGNPKLKRSGVQVEYTNEQLIEITRCIKDPVYFIKNYVNEEGIENHYSIYWEKQVFMDWTLRFHHLF